MLNFNIEYCSVQEFILLLLLLLLLLFVLFVQFVPGFLLEN